MNTRTLTTLAVLAFIVGLCFELLNSSQPLTTPRARRSIKVSMDFENLTSSNLKPSTAKFQAALEPVDNTSQIVADVTQNTAKNDETKEKKDEKKKKKKPQAAQPVQPTTVAKSPKTDDESKKSLTPKGGGAGSMLSSAATKKADDRRATAEEWLTYILETPEDSGRLLELVSAYQVNEISETVFYSVISALAVQTDTRLQHFAILGLIGTPSVHSFRLLVELQYSNQTSSQTQAQARSSLSDYASQNHFAMMVSLLNPSEDPIVTLEALSLVRRMVSSGAVNFRAGRSVRDFDRRNRSNMNSIAHLRQLRQTLSNLAQNSGTRSDVRNAAYSLLNQVPNIPIVPPRPRAPTT